MPVRERKKRAVLPTEVGGVKPDFGNTPQRSLQLVPVLIFSGIELDELHTCQNDWGRVPVGARYMNEVEQLVRNLVLESVI